MPKSVERVTKVMTNSSLYWARPLRFEIVGWVELARGTLCA